MMQLAGASLLAISGGGSSGNDGAQTTPSALTPPPSSAYRMRPFDPVADQVHLEEMCRDVYGGSDYLPRAAKSMASDPLCSFVVLVRDGDDVPAAVGNLRNDFLPGRSWLEAVRTAERYRNLGLAARITGSLSEEARERGNELMTCTVGSNAAMRRVLEGAGLRNLGRINLCSFDKLRDLPGWGVGGDGDGSEGPPPQVEARSFLRALNLEGLVGEQARRSVWSPIGTMEELRSALEEVRAAGGCGHVVGPYELVAKSTLEQSLRAGLIQRSEVGGETVVLAFVRDEMIVSLRSNWCCSVATTTVAGLEAALWRACSDEVLPLPSGDATFFLAFDGAVPIDIPGSLCAALPLVDSDCLLYGTETA